MTNAQKLHRIGCADCDYIGKAYMNQKEITKEIVQSLTDSFSVIGKTIKNKNDKWLLTHNINIMRKLVRLSPINYD